MKGKKQSVDERPKKWINKPTTLEVKKKENEHEICAYALEMVARRRLFESFI